MSHVSLTHTRVEINVELEYTVDLKTLFRCQNQMLYLFESQTTIVIKTD